MSEEEQPGPDVGTIIEEISPITRKLTGTWTVIIDVDGHYDEISQYLSWSKHPGQPPRLRLRRISANPKFYEIYGACWQVESVVWLFPWWFTVNTGDNPEDPDADCIVVLKRSFWVRRYWPWPKIPGYAILWRGKLWESIDGSNWLRLSDFFRWAWWLGFRRWRGEKMVPEES